jgi:tripeptide aminopeptidase
MQLVPKKYTVTDRFLNYVTIDTQSDPNSPTCPSTEKQKNLGRLLVQELLEMGISDAELDENGYVYGTLKSNTNKAVPNICFCSHMDTSPDCSGENVKPIIHKNYNGGSILYASDANLSLNPDEHPALKDQIGNDIITSDGTTLLGADNKAGVAEIMDAIYQLIQNPSIKHGDIKILFTPDEEIGRGVEKVNLAKVNAKFAYTIDGETLGHIEDETFSADAVNITIHGVSTHPGFAKNKMESAIKIAAAIVSALPKNILSPETTEGREGFIHPTGISGSIEKSTLQFIIRDFDTKQLAVYENELKELVEKVMLAYPNASFEFEVVEQYRNMKEVLLAHPEIVAYAVEAIERAGMKPFAGGIRGGTDGSRLSFMGLPCPNIFAGEHAFHSRLEWVSIQDMQKAVDTIMNLVVIWEEKTL